MQVKYNFSHVSSPSKTHKPLPARPATVRSLNRKADILPLPFSDSHRKISFAEWVYRHQVGLLVTVVVHLTLIIMFLTYQIMITPGNIQSVTIDMIDEQFEKPQQEQREIEQLEAQQYEQVRNRVSNDNSKLNANLRDDRNSRTSDLYEEAQRVQQQLASSGDAYRRGVAELENASKRKPKTTEDNNASKGKDSKRETAYVKGNVTVSYDLPDRTDVYLHIPAYQCESGGMVVVGITVNRNGKVLSAAVEKATSTGDDCTLNMAVQAAKATTFNTSGVAPEKQKGTITYLFVAQ